MTREELNALINGSRKDAIFFTHAGVQLTVKEHKFIDCLLREGDPGIAAQEAGYQVKDSIPARFSAKGRSILKKPYIYEEIQYRIAELERDAVADSAEILSYFTRVMRGEEKDQFGLEAPLAERTSAAKELAKRIVDTVKPDEDKTIKIQLDWGRNNDASTTNVSTD